MDKKPIKIRTVTSIFIFLIMGATVFSLSRLMRFLMNENFQDHERLFIMNVAFFVMHGLIWAVLSRTTTIFVTKPIETLTKATSEIARGNFNIELDSRMRAQEIRELAENFNVMTKELASMTMFREDFISNVSHEFKTPLSVIEGYSNLLKNPLLDETTRQYYISKIVEQTKHLSVLTGNILQLSRLESQEVVLEKHTFCVDEQLREVLLGLETQWEAKHLNLDLALESVSYYGNEELLKQVWQNVLHNAIKFSKSDGDLGVRLSVTDKYVKVEVRDTGIGMSESEVRHIFDKFYQSDTSHATMGHGLGLPIVKKIIELHHGQIRVRSEKGKQTTITIVLPRRP